MNVFSNPTVKLQSKVQAHCQAENDLCNTQNIQCTVLHFKYEVVFFSQKESVTLSMFLSLFCPFFVMNWKCIK